VIYTLQLYAVNVLSNSSVHTIGHIFNSGAWGMQGGAAAPGCNREGRQFDHTHKQFSMKHFSENHVLIFRKCFVDIF